MAIAQFREGGQRASYPKIVALAVLIGAGLTFFPPKGWAVDGGYGPVGDSSSGGSGTLGNLIVAKTIGPTGGSVSGDFHGITINVFIPPGEFASDEIVEILSSTPNCRSLRGQDNVIGLAILAIKGEQSTDKFSRDAVAIVSSPKITPHSLLISSEHDSCAVVHGLIGNGRLAVSLQSSSAFVVTSGAQNSSVRGTRGEHFEGWVHYEFFPKF